MSPNKELSKLDNVDRKILAVLQRDASYSVSRLADEIGLSKSACWRRIQALEEDGVITARVALLDQHKLGLDLTVFTAIRTIQHTQDWYDKFSAVVASMPNVTEVHRMSGDIDYLMRAVVPDMRSYDAMYRDMINNIDLSDVSSSFSMETIKYSTALPLDYL
ncbi:MAG: Lrp/AsnC family transcriptional regulator [Rhodothermales bacterium]|jgi:Lrp/AsnC family transcriptional regulator